MVHMPSKRNDCGSTIGKVCTERDLKTKDVTEYHLKDDLLHERKHKEIVYETITKDEVLRRVHEGGQKLVIVCGNVYNIERLGDIHPGGRKVTIYFMFSGFLMRLLLKTMIIILIHLSIIVQQ